MADSPFPRQILDFNETIKPPTIKRGEFTSFLSPPSPSPKEEIKERPRGWRIDILPEERFKKIGVIDMRATRVRCNAVGFEKIAVESVLLFRGRGFKRPSETVEIEKGR